MQTIANGPGNWAYVIGPYREPVATVQPGETFAVETADAFENKIDSPDADITKLIVMPFVNPLAGPIYVDGAEKGDTLAVTIHSIDVTARLRRERAHPRVRRPVRHRLHAHAEPAAAPEGDAAPYQRRGSHLLRAA